MFDRDAFQSLGDEGLCKVNEKYNILCPQVFVTECLLPNNASEVESESLLRRLKLIENPIVLTGNTNVSYKIMIPSRTQYPTILTSEQIARNCITSDSITMESVTLGKLISYCELYKDCFNDEIHALNAACRRFEGTLTPRRLDLQVQRYFQETHNITLSREEIRDRQRENERPLVTQELRYAAGEALEEIKSKSVDENIEAFETFFSLTNEDIGKLKDLIQDDRSFTAENYPDLSYPIYLYYLIVFITCARQHNTEHLDQSYARDFRYLHYLNFCDRFITNERSTPHIVNSFPFSNIRNTPISTSAELKSGLN